MSHLDVYDPLIVTFLLFLPVLNHLLSLELFVYLRLILSLPTSAHLTVLSLFNPALNLTFSLLPITSSHPHTSASDSTFDFWRYIHIWLTLTLTLAENRRVLSLVLDVGRHCEDVTSDGRLFQVLAAATGNARSPIVESRVSGTASATDTIVTRSSCLAHG